MFQEEVILKILTQMCLGILALHSLRIMHRDLKSANIFLTDDNIVKVGDLNVSKLARQDGLNYTQAGTPYYASPEVWKDKPYDFLYIDSREQKGFRKNFNERIDIRNGNAEKTPKNADKEEDLK